MASGSKGTKFPDVLFQTVSAAVGQGSSDSTEKNSLEQHIAADHEDDVKGGGGGIGKGASFQSVESATTVGATEAALSSSDVTAYAPPAATIGTASRMTFDVVSVHIPTYCTKDDDQAGTTAAALQLATGMKRRYTAFCIHVRVAMGYSWVVERRYTQFYILHKALKQRFPLDMSKLRFPAKKMFRSLARSTVEKRRKAFQEYLIYLLLLRPRPVDLNNFLEVPKHARMSLSELARISADVPKLDIAETTVARPSTSAVAVASAAATAAAAAAAGGSGTGEKASGIGKVSIEDFELLKTLGKGSFGRVFLVRRAALGAGDQPTKGNLFAMKVLKKSDVKRRRQVEHTKTERNIMGTIGQAHPFIVTLQYAFQTKDKLYMVTNFCRGGELFFHLKRMRRFSETMCRFYSAEITLALSHLHSNNIVYRDLKPENVLLEEDGHIRLTDFGLSRENVNTPNGATTFCGTPEYLSPEMILHRQTRKGYGKSVDWWSLGTLMYEMLTGNFFFHVVIEMRNEMNVVFFFLDE